MVGGGTKVVQEITGQNRILPGEKNIDVLRSHVFPQTAKAWRVNSFNSGRTPVTMGKFGKHWEPETIVCVIDGCWKEARRSGNTTQIKPCKSEGRYDVLKYLTPKI